MRTPRPPDKGFPFGRVVVAAVILATLLALVSVQLNRAIGQGQASCTLCNARQLHIATLRMTTDVADDAGLGRVPNPSLGWPGDVLDLKSVADFAERMIEYKYLDRSDLKSLFYAPGVQAYPGTGRLMPENSAFKIYKVRDADVSQVIFIATKNFTFGQPLDENAVPFGKRHAAMMRKGGEGIIFNDQQATHSSEGIIGFNVGGTSMEDVGPPSVPLL